MRNWWDKRAQERQNYYDLSGQSDRPSWRWRGTGRYEYTTSPDAAAYVRQFAAMKAAKEAARQTRLTIVPKSPQQLLIEAASRVPAAARVA